MDKRQFWRQFISGAVGIALGAFSIGLVVGGLLIYRWPSGVYAICGACLVLFMVSSALMKSSSKYMTRLVQEHEEKEAAKGNQFGKVIGIPVHEPEGKPARGDDG